MFVFHLPKLELVRSRNVTHRALLRLLGAYINGLPHAIGIVVAAPAAITSKERAGATIVDIDR